MELPEIENLLAERFRSERKRLNLSAESVAHFCQVSNSTVFNWEARKARIPLSAVALLWRHGLDIQALVRTDMKDAHLHLHPVEDGETVAVPRELLLRHGLDENTAFVYQCPSQIGKIMPAGELCLLAWHPPGREALAEAKGMFLVTSKCNGKEAFCKMEASGSNLLRMALNGRQVMIGQKQFLAHFEILGEYIERLGYRPFTDDADSLNLNNFVAMTASAKAG